MYWTRVVVRPLNANSGACVLCGAKESWWLGFAYLMHLDGGDSYNVSVSFVRKRGLHDNLKTKKGTNFHWFHPPRKLLLVFVTLYSTHLLSLRCISLRKRIVHHRKIWAILSKLSSHCHILQPPEPRPMWSDSSWGIALRGQMINAPSWSQMLNSFAWRVYNWLSFLYVDFSHFLPLDHAFASPFDGHRWVWRAIDGLNVQSRIYLFNEQ